MCCRCVWWLLRHRWTGEARADHPWPSQGTSNTHVDSQGGKGELRTEKPCRDLGQLPVLPVQSRRPWVHRVYQILPPSTACPIQRPNHPQGPGGTWASVGLPAQGLHPEAGWHQGNVQRAGRASPVPLLWAWEGTIAPEVSGVGSALPSGMWVPCTVQEASDQGPCKQAHSRSHRATYFIEGLLQRPHRIQMRQR